MRMAYLRSVRRADAGKSKENKRTRENEREKEGNAERKRKKRRKKRKKRNLHTALPFASREITAQHGVGFLCLPHNQLLLTTMQPTSPPPATQLDSTRRVFPVQSARPLQELLGPLALSFRRSPRECRCSTPGARTRLYHGKDDSGHSVRHSS